MFSAFSILHFFLAILKITFRFFSVGDDAKLVEAEFTVPSLDLQWAYLILKLV